jgi:predicted RNA-binding Zn-ribbon protein involved in translation (DUF1610 family)
MPARTCAVCGSTVRVPDDKMGQTFNCPECGEPVTASGSSAKMKRGRTQPRKPSTHWAAVLTGLAIIFAAAVLLLCWHWFVRRG